jgi:hypothetical protein
MPLLDICVEPANQPAIKDVAFWHKSLEAHALVHYIHVT